jgi:hypothetical protein
MPALGWERPEDFLNLDEFATQVELWRGGAVLRSFPAIFDEPSANASIGEARTGGGDRRFDTTTPMITTAEANVAGAVRGDEIRVGSRRFDVMGLPEVQGDGWAKLRLAPQFGHSGR